MDVEVNGCRLWYDVRGSGAHLLQIGGSGLGHLNFPRPFTEEMTRRFTVIESDQRGSGRSDRPEGRYTIDVWADDYAAFLDALGIERTFVHGHSTGGMIAMKLAANRPDLVAGLVVGSTSAKLDTYGRFQMATRKALARAYGLDSVELAQYSATIAFSRAFLASPEAADAIRRIAETLASTVTLERWCETCDVATEVDLRDDLAKIVAPTLVTAGELDDNTPLDAGPQGAGQRYIAEHIANAELSVLEGCGFYRLIERPRESAEIVGDFLASIDAGG